MSSQCKHTCVTWYVLVVYHMIPLHMCTSRVTYCKQSMPQHAVHSTLPRSLLVCFATLLITCLLSLLHELCRYVIVLSTPTPCVYSTAPQISCGLLPRLLKSLEVSFHGLPSLLRLAQMYWFRKSLVVCFHDSSSLCDLCQVVKLSSRQVGSNLL